MTRRGPRVGIAVRKAYTAIYSRCSFRAQADRPALLLLAASVTAGSVACEDAPCPLETRTGEPYPVDIAASGISRFAVMSNGKLWCWGDVAGSECGSRFGGFAQSPVRAGPPDCLVDVAVGSRLVAGRTASNAALLWGPDAYELVEVDALGVGELQLDGEVAAIAPGIEQVVMLLSSGRVYQAGFVLSREESPALRPVLLPERANKVAAWLHACALGESGAVYCWGRNPWGALGNGSLADTSVPTIMPLPERAVDVVIAGSVTCALGESGTVYCAGDNLAGGLALPDYKVVQQSMMPIQGVPSMRQIWAGDDTVCALSVAEELWCWGQDPGSVGHPELGFGPLPFAVPEVTQVKKMVFGEGNACILRSDSTVWCAGLLSYKGLCKPIGAGFEQVSFTGESCERP